MASEVEICNLALSHIRAGSINSLTESSLQAQQCGLLYPVLRDQLLEDAPWQFAHGIKPLAVLSSVDVFNWVYAYQYPSDCLKINRLVINYEEASQDSSIIAARLYDYGLPQPDLDRQVEYQIFNVDGNRVIAANESELRIDYVQRVEDPNLFGSQFIMALSYLLAAELAVSLAGIQEGRQLRSDSIQMYNKYINAAMARNLNEQYKHTPDSEFITVRT